MRYGRDDDDHDNPYSNSERDAFDAQRASRVSRTQWADPLSRKRVIPTEILAKIKKPHLLKAYARLTCPRSKQIHVVAIIGRSFVMLDHTNAKGEAALASLAGKAAVRCRCHVVRDQWATLALVSGDPRNRGRYYCARLGDFPRELLDLRGACRPPANNMRSLSLVRKSRHEREYGSTVLRKLHPVPSKPKPAEARFRAIRDLGLLRLATEFSAALRPWLVKRKLSREFCASLSIDVNHSYAAPRAYWNDSELTIATDILAWCSRLGTKERACIGRWFVINVAPTTDGDSALAWAVDLEVCAVGAGRDPATSDKDAAIVADYVGLTEPQIGVITGVGDMRRFSPLAAHGGEIKLEERLMTLSKAFRPNVPVV